MFDRKNKCVNLCYYTCYQLSDNHTGSETKLVTNADVAKKKE